MKSQTSLPIQYSDGSRPDASRGINKNPDSYGTAFQTRLNESIIDVYERSEVHAAVADERTGADRRASSTRRHSSPESTALQSGDKVMDLDVYSPDQKTKQTDNKAEKPTPAIFSPSQEKGRLLDTWA
jgi:hypothetical protein